MAGHYAEQLVAGMLDKVRSQPRRCARLDASVRGHARQHVAKRRCGFPNLSKPLRVSGRAPRIL
jgi:hypothetical protein